MSIQIQPVVLADSDALISWILEFNAHEEIDTPATRIRPGLQKLLSHPELGGAYWICRDDGPTRCGYAILTYGFDLEYGGRDAWLTDLYIRPELRAQGSGTQAFALLEAQARQAGAGALHLVVRRENLAAQRAYAKNGMTENPRLLMIKLLTL